MIYNTKTGNVTLGQLNGFLRALTDEDNLYRLAQIKMNNNEISFKTKNSCQKKWNRLIAETGKDEENAKDYFDYSFSSHDGILALISKFFSELQENYNYTENLPVLTFLIYNEYITRLKEYNPVHTTNPLPENPDQNSLIIRNILLDYLSYSGSLKPDQSLKELPPPILPAFFDTAKLSFFNLVNAIGKNIFLLNNELGEEKIKTLVSSAINLYTYNDLFNELKEERDCSSKEKLYENLGYDDKRQQLIEICSTDHVKKWAVLDDILPMCSPELQKKFITKYLLENLESALKEKLFITETQILQIKESLKNFCASTDSCHDVLKYLYSLVTEFPFANGEQYLFSIIGPLTGNFVKHIYKKTGIEKALQSLNYLKTTNPQLTYFFEPWLQAYLELVQRDFSLSVADDIHVQKASEYFDEAFKYKYLAGDFLELFLKMGFAFENYCNVSWSYMIDSMTDEGKNPISCPSKKFLSFGNAIQLFPESAKTAYLEAKNAQEYFYIYFPPKCFINDKDAESKLKKEFENRETVNVETDGRSKEEFSKEHPYEVLSKLVTSKQRNTLLPENNLFTLSKDHNPKQKPLYAPLALCIKYSTIDSRLLTLAETWISDKENPVDLSLVSYDGHTALSVSLYLYARARIRNSHAEMVNKKFNNSITEENRKMLNQLNIPLDHIEYMIETSSLIPDDLARFKNISYSLAQNVSWEKELKFGTTIPTLISAIKTFDFELVKIIADKIPQEDFQTCQITNKELSPLACAIIEKEPLALGDSEFIRKINDPSVIHTMNISSIIGLSRNDKQNNYTTNFPVPNREEYSEYKIHKMWKYENIPDEEHANFFETYGTLKYQKEALENCNKIIDYFISRTKNIDEVCMIFSSSDGDYFTCSDLYIAASSNDSQTCRKLLNLHADVSGNIDKNKTGGIIHDFWGTENNRINFSFTHNFINRCILYKSWEVLEMFLTEYKNLASEYMHNDKYGMNSFALYAMKVRDYFIWTGEEKRYHKEVVQYFIKLFLEAGANPDEETPVGTARQLFKDINFDL